MQTIIKTLDFSLTDALRRHADRRLRFALTSFDEHIRRVVMRLSNSRGARGAADKCCQLQVVLDGLPDVVVEDVEVDLYVAIGRAANRAGRTVRRRLARRRDRDRAAGPHDAASIAELPTATL